MNILLFENTKTYAVFLLTDHSFSEANNVQDTPASNRDCTISINTCVSPFHLKRVFFIKSMFLPVENAV
jgi:hypothetical protein